MKKPSRHGARHLRFLLVALAAVSALDLALLAAPTLSAKVHAIFAGDVATATPRVVPDISKTPAGREPIRDRLLARLAPGKPESIFDIVDAIQADPALALNCHEIAHDIGHRAYELYGFSGAMNFTDAARLGHASVQDVCAGGYVHGVLEEASLYQDDFEANPGAMCAGMAGEQRASCFHGVGHALMFAYRRRVEPSLVGCRASGGADDAARCFEGVWMELFWGDTKRAGKGSLGWSEDDPLAPCVATGEDAKAACFLYASFGYLRAHPKDYSGAVALCDGSSLRERDEAFCLQGVGITQVSRFKAGGLERAEPLVAGLGDAMRAAFYKGVIRYAALAGVGRAELEGTCARFEKDGGLCAEAVAGAPFPG